MSAVSREVTVDVVLPVLNEAEALPWVLDRMPEGYRTIVVDNGSTDGSADIARRRGVTVIEETTQGFGSACFAGLSAATADLVAFMDCDGSLDPGELPSLVALVAEGRCDLAIGARDADHGAWPIHARIANRFLAARVRRITSTTLTDIGPMRVANRVCLVDLDLQDRRSGWPLEMVLRAAGAGWRIAELPVRYRTRSGRSKVTGTVRGTVTAVRDMRRELARFG